ncbi:MAG: hypothetical protein ABW186_04855 [Rhodanobacteraceae bacterium]
MSALANLLDLTRNMFAAAHSGDFDRVSALDAERRAMLEAGLLPEADSATLADAILACDRELVAEVARARSLAGEQLRQARLAQAGVGSYLGVAFPR